MPLINCEISLMLTWSETCSLDADIADQVATFTIADTRPYVPAVTLPT